MEEEDFEWMWQLQLPLASHELTEADYFDVLELELLILMEEDNINLEDLGTMLQVDNQRRGNPASRSFVRNLPLVHLQEEGDACGICMEDIGVQELVKMLPCRHHFHGQCIDPWFELRNTCPVCRYRLPTNNPGEEEEIGYG